jgi:hypothetical protein
MSVEVVYAELEATRVAWDELQELLANGGYDSKKILTILDGESLSALDARVRLAVELLLSMRSSATDSIEAIVVGSKDADLTSQLRSLSQQTQEILRQIKTHWREGSTIRDANAAFLLQFFEGESNYVNLDMGPNLAQVQTAAKYLVGLLGSLLALVKADSISDLSARAAAVAKLTQECEGLRKQIQHFAKSAGQDSAKTAEHQKAAAATLAQAEVVLASLRELQQRASTDASSVASLVEQIKSTGAKSEALSELVLAYELKFEAFQKELDARNAAFAQFEKEASLAIKQNIDREKEIDRLAKLADSMISGATTAGLGKSLEDTRARYEERMNSARNGFGLSVLLLVVSALPLAGHLLPGLFGDLFPKVAEGVHSSWYGVLGKVLLLVPATWLAGFYTKSYADFFHLEREYAHKAALAGAVDGFKRQAPQYQEEITAEVFLEIRNNPARGQSAEPAAHPLYDVLAKVVSKVIDRKKDDEVK